MEHLKMHSPNLVDQNIDRLAELFPDCVTEARDDDGNLRKAIDFDQLRQQLSRHIVDGPQERYQLNWPGKREALLTANAPIAKTLRPCRDESVNFDRTENLFIEGDNLDALKLLQETYLGKIKMIYIDPPYNTGNDFIYNDDFAEDLDSYTQRSNQKDEDGNRLVANTEANGRFHSDWLSMMYSRLKLARNLLCDSGVIFISIDENEFNNLLKVSDEVFGEDNYVGAITWKNCTDNNPTNIAMEHEYIAVYSKNKNDIEKVWKSSVSDVKSVLINKFKELSSKYSLDELSTEYLRWFRSHKVELWPLDGYKNIDENGIYAGIRGVHNPGKDGYRYDVLHPVTGSPCKEPLMGYRFPESTMNRLLAEGKIIFGEDESKIIELKSYAQDYQEKLSSVFELDNRSGAYDVRDLFTGSKSLFENPKPVKLIQKFVSLATSKDDVVLDFFAGSSSTAHAVMKLNAETHEQRKFVMIQLNAPCDGGSQALNAGYRTIADLSKERIRRAGQKILEDNPDKNLESHLDIGFRVLKIDSSNMADIYYRPDALTQADLLDQVDNVKAGRTEEDLLFQVMLDWGVELTLPIRRETIDGKTVFFVADNALVACFDTHGGITDAFARQLATYHPKRLVFRDSGFAADSTRINVEQALQQLSPDTDVKSI